MNSTQESQPLLATGRDVEKTAAVIGPADLASFLSDLTGVAVEVTAVEDAAFDSATSACFLNDSDCVAQVVADAALAQTLQHATGSADSLCLLSALMSSRYSSPLRAATELPLMSRPSGTRTFACTAAGTSLGRARVLW